MRLQRLGAHLWFFELTDDCALESGKGMRYCPLARPSFPGNITQALADICLMYMYGEGQKTG